jgi:hypothetical protein
MAHCCKLRMVAPMLQERDGARHLLEQQVSGLNHRLCELGQDLWSLVRIPAWLSLPLAPVLGSHRVFEGLCVLCVCCVCVVCVLCCVCLGGLLACAWARRSSCACAILKSQTCARPTPSWCATTCKRWIALHPPTSVAPRLQGDTLAAESSKLAAVGKEHGLHQARLEQRCRLMEVCEG